MVWMYQAIRRSLVVAGLMAGWVGIGLPPEVQASEALQLSLIPASLNADRTVYLAAGHTQPVDFMLQASEKVTGSGADCPIEMVVELPAGIRFRGASGGWNTKGFPVIRDLSNRRQQIRLQFEVPPGYFAGKPGETLVSEWRAQSFFIEVEQAAVDEPGEVKVELRSAHGMTQNRWPLRVMSLIERSEKRPELTTIGLWSYGLHRAGYWDNRVEKDGGGNSAWLASDGVARFLANAGINFVQRGEGTFHAAARRHGVTIGGDSHHSLFDGGDELRDYTVNGRALVDHFASAVRVLKLPENAVIPGVREMVRIARQQDGMATIDYEPIWGEGFSPDAIALFKAEQQISDERFDAFQAYFQKMGSRLYVEGSAEMLAIYRQWVQFHSRQCAAYVKRITDGVRSLDPQVRVVLTPNPTFDDQSLMTLGFGYNAAPFAQYVDVIMPQIYNGYGGVGAQLTLQTVRGWREAMASMGATSELWPILLVRYAGAEQKNLPARVRQQIIGTLAEGAEGFLLYYPSQMDAPYWQMVAHTTDEIARYEYFYQRGTRVDERFSVREMPMGHEMLSVYPRHEERVENPRWSFTAHEHDGSVLLTMLNLDETGDMTFTVDVPENYRVHTEAGVQRQDDGRWQVQAQDVGFVILKP